MSRPLWVVDVDRRTFPALDGDVEADLAVVGGGFSGLGAAWAASQLGASAVLLEVGTVATGASGRNAGFVGAGPALGFTASAAAIGRVATLDIWRLTEANHRLLVSLIEELEIECGYLRRGSMALAASEEEWEDISAELALMAAVELSACPVPAMSLPRPFHRMYQGGIYYAGNAEFQPAAFLFGLADRLPRSVRVFEQTRVTRVHGCRDPVLDTERGTVRARAAVLATNAYTRSLIPSVPIAPTRGQIAATAPLDEVVVPFPMHANRGFQYWRQTPDGRLVVGGWRDTALEQEVGLEQTLNSVIQNGLSDFIRHVVPHATVALRWAGIMGFTPDRFPLVGAIPGAAGLYVAAGYSGHGVAMAFICGYQAARAALGQTAYIPSAFSPARFGTIQ